MYKRLLDLSQCTKSFFLWGQRQTGKSSLLRATFPDALYIDLLRSDEFLTFSSRPSLLRERTATLKKGQITVIDEVQKVPLLLDEVHHLIESKRIQFALCGSSARKVKRGHANLLGGRARRFELYGLSAVELGDDFDLLKMVNRGYLPSHYLDDDYFSALESYVGDYLKEEILAEGLTRSVSVFTRFLEVAALGDTEILNFSNVARETGVTVKTAQAHYEILVDTLTGALLPAYTKRIKRRTRHSPKFFFHDVGVVNYLVRRRHIEVKTPTFGKAFENWVFHELTCYLKYAKVSGEISYWQLTTGIEVDFIIGDMKVAIEAKGTDHVTSDHLKNLRELKRDFKSVKHLVVVCLETHERKTEDGILILPYSSFLTRLWQGEWNP